MDNNKQHGGTVEKIGMGLVFTILKLLRREIFNWLKGYQALTAYLHTEMARSER